MIVSHTVYFLSLTKCQVWEAGVKVQLLLKYRKHSQQVPNAAKCKLTTVAKIMFTVTITVLAKKCCNILNTSAFKIHQLCKHTNITYAS